MTGTFVGNVRGLDGQEELLKEKVTSIVNVVVVAKVEVDELIILFIAVVGTFRNFEGCIPTGGRNWTGRLLET